MAKKLPPIHPGEILREEFLVPLKLTPYAVAAALHVPRTRIERIAREEKPVTADTALRLGKFFKTGAAFWMNIQARYDLETAEDGSRRRSGRSPPTRRREMSLHRQRYLLFLLRAIFQDDSQRIGRRRPDKLQGVGVVMIERTVPSLHQKLRLNEIGPASVVVEGDVASVTLRAESFVQKLR